MARVETVKCDQCGAIKGEGNHWLWIDVVTRVPANADVLDAQGPLIWLNYEQCEDGFDRHDLCGQDCFHKHLDALLFTKPKPTD